MIKDLSKDVLLKCHDEYMKDENNDKTYTGYSKQFIELRKRIPNWSDIGAGNFRLIAIKFANAWKSRTNSSQGIARRVANNLKKVKKELIYFENKDIRNIDFDKDGSKIIAIYECFEKVNSTAIPKILHMTNKRLFPMWDERIRKMYGVFANAQGYCIFMLLIQKQLNRFGTNRIKETERKAGYPILKIIDEYNWNQANAE